MECVSGDPITSKMVTTISALRLRREIIQAKLQERTRELKRLCIQEAELTGILPPETPIEPDHSPPRFRRRVEDTVLIQPSHFANRLKLRDTEKKPGAVDKSCTSTSCSAITNENLHGKSYRNRQQLRYRLSQRGLSDLEPYLEDLHSNKPLIHVQCSPTDGTDCIDGPSTELALEAIASHLNYDSIMPLAACSGDSILRNHHFYNSFGKSRHGHWNPNYQWNRNQQFRRSIQRTHHNSVCFDENSNWMKEKELISPGRNTAPVEHFAPNHHLTDFPLSPSTAITPELSFNRSFRHSHYGCNNSTNDTCPFPDFIPRSGSYSRPRSNSFTKDINPPLLPCQTYPDVNLSPTKKPPSIGSPSVKQAPGSPQVELFTKEILQLDSFSERKLKKKEWRETELDLGVDMCTNSHFATTPGSPSPLTVSPRPTKFSEMATPPRPKSSATHTPPPLPPPYCSTPTSPPSPVSILQSSIKSPIPFPVETVPFESPKNHTVVEIGKWQPYREVSKPFEMSDFYKYSTKYNKKDCTVEQKGRTE